MRVPERRPPAVLRSSRVDVHLVAEGIAARAESTVEAVLLILALKSGIARTTDEEALTAAVDFGMDAWCCRMYGGSAAGRRGGCEYCGCCQDYGARASRDDRAMLPPRIFGCA